MSSQENNIMLTDGDLDAAIAREVLKHTILGVAPCWYCEGSWQVMPEVTYSTSIRPIQYAWDNKCHCNLESYKEMEEEIYKDETPEDRQQRYKRDFFNGHETVCLTAVPKYSQWLEEALNMVQVFKPCSFSLTYIDRLWVAEINDEFGTYTAKMPGIIDSDECAATVICWAVLKSVRKMVDPKPLSTPRRWFNRLVVCSVKGHDEHGFGGSYGWKCRRCES